MSLPDARLEEIEQMEGEPHPVCLQCSAPVEPYYLIERNDRAPHEWLRHIDPCFTEWTIDAQTASRWATRDDAERAVANYRVALTLPGLAVTEHQDMAGANYYPRLVGFGPGTVTEKEAQHMFDEEKKRCACVKCGATGVELYMTIEPSCINKEACTLRAENNRLRSSLDDVNREYDALTATANRIILRIILRIAHLESLVAPTSAVPISEADVGKTIGITCIHDDKTTQTVRSDTTRDLRAEVAAMRAECAEAAHLLAEGVRHLDSTLADLEAERALVERQAKVIVAADVMRNEYRKTHPTVRPYPEILAFDSARAALGDKL